MDMRLKCDLRPNPAPLPPPEAPRPALKSTALGRMDDLHLFLRQCDDIKYISSYEKVRNVCRRAIWSVAAADDALMGAAAAAAPRPRSC